MTAPTLRRVARSARRIVHGGRGLGFGTTARWGIHQLAHRDPELVNTSLTWVHADAANTTVVWINNYWSDAYDIASPHLAAELIDVDGVTVGAFSIDLAPDETRAVDVRAELAGLGVGLPFQGQLLLRLEHERVVPNRPVQVFAEYRRDDGECSGVHGQYGLLSTPAAQVVSAMRVESNADTRTAFVVTNAYDGPGTPHPMHAELTVHAEDGRTWHAPIARVPTRGTVVAYADELIPGLSTMLAGRPAHARILLACPSSRIATFIESGTDRRVIVNHGTVDRAFDQEPGIPAAWTESWPVASAFVTIDGDRDTVISLPNVWGPRADDYIAGVNVYRPDGTIVASHDVPVDRDCFREISMQSLLGTDQGSVFHAEVCVRSHNDHAERPHTFDMLVGVRIRGELRAEAQVGAEFYNAPVPPGVRWMDIRRTRIFGRVDQTVGHRTSIFLAHPVGQSDVGSTTSPLLTLISADGTRRAETTVPLAPHGCVQFAVDELFADADDVLGPDGFGQLRVRDTGARLYGYSWVDHPTAATFPLDHLIGG